jgi:Fe/S biogenesis protein NfuA
VAEEAALLELTFTPAAQVKIRDILRAKGQAGFAVRMRVVGRDTDNFQYEFRSVEEATRRPDDVVLSVEGFSVFVDPESARHLNGAAIDFGGLGSGGFRIENPNPVWTDETARAVARVIAEQINPAIAAHSGSVTLVDVRDDTVYVRLNGGCQGCGAAGITLKLGIERQIRQAVPNIQSVVDLTEHDKGHTPFYAPGQTGRSPVVPG